MTTPNQQPSVELFTIPGGMRLEFSAYLQVILLPVPVQRMDVYPQPHPGVYYTVALGSSTYGGEQIICLLAMERQLMYAKNRIMSDPLERRSVTGPLGILCIRRQPGVGR